MSIDALERGQVWWYLTAVALGLVVGTLAPGLGDPAEALVWPVLAVLLFATFTQLPLAGVARALTDGRFLTAALVGNFVVAPLLVWGLVSLAPPEEAVRLGLYLVLLVPCTDWFITFTQLGRGDAARATSLTPMTLLLQLALLPLYLAMFAGWDVVSVFRPSEVWPAALVVLVPLAAAALCEPLWRRGGSFEKARSGLGWGPVPLLAVVILLVAISHVGPVRAALDVLGIVVLVAGAYLVVALLAARLLAAAWRLPVEAGRTLAFSMGTRNSFIVLPFALALPPGWEVVAIVVVAQSLVELLGMIAYLTLVPRVFRERATPRSAVDGVSRG